MGPFSLFLIPRIDQAPITPRARVMHAQADVTAAASRVSPTPDSCAVAAGHADAFPALRRKSPRISPRHVWNASVQVTAPSQLRPSGWDGRCRPGAAHARICDVFSGGENEWSDEWDEKE